jgi:hypothetical protein
MVFPSAGFLKIDVRKQPLSFFTDVEVQKNVICSTHLWYLEDRLGVWSEKAY